MRRSGLRQPGCGSNETCVLTRLNSTKGASRATPPEGCDCPVLWSCEGARRSASNHRLQVSLRGADEGSHVTRFARSPCWNSYRKGSPGPPAHEDETVSIQVFLVCLALGSAAVALWVNVRFPKLMPWSLRRLLVHLIVAFVVVKSVSPAMGWVAESGVPAAGLTSIFLVAFPVLVYEFLVGAWMIRLAQTSGFGFRA
jgi:hypothetical protein